jgi:hypothetical protein
VADEHRQPIEPIERIDHRHDVIVVAQLHPVVAGAVPGERRRNRVHTGRGEPLAHGVPAASDVPRAVHEHEGRSGYMGRDIEVIGPRKRLRGPFIGQSRLLRPPESGLARRAGP